MCDLGRYHVRDILEWDKGYCKFHSLVVCLRGNCKDDVTYEGKVTIQQMSLHILSMPWHMK